MTLTIQDRKVAALLTPSALTDNVVKELSGALTALLADWHCISRSRTSTGTCRGRIFATTT